MSDHQGRKELKFLHTSDVHLGAYDHSKAERTLERRQEMHDTFRAVIDLSITERVDFMVIAGDFFDNARVQEDTMQFAGEQLARVPGPVILLPGNHDHVGPGSVYDRLDLTELAPNLRLMRTPEGESVMLPDLGVELWGRSHTELDPNFRPFEDAPRRGEADWHIGVGHGHFLHPMSADHSSYHIYEDHFSVLDHDYFALGHWEQQTRVAAGEGLAAYSGAPDGLAGHTGGRVLMVHLESDGTVRLESHPLREGAERLAHDEIPILEGSPMPAR
ncbi:MAG: DNA repair exonuclease [Chloroflexi bacterium]|nr:DNA repair exonuclease [Chloroflexota bacterium]MYI83150.1 DNA repair exonuclease [Chloroflexota bacterium]